jgi:hypothetical protein
MKIKFLFVLAALAFLSACKDDDCVQENKCSDKPPTDELCLAAFQTWFYNPETSECEQKSYSGCNSYGFETEEECKKCDCND